MQKIFEELYKGKCWGENVKKAMINETKVQLTEGWDNFNHVHTVHENRILNFF